MDALIAEALGALSRGDLATADRLARESLTAAPMSGAALHLAGIIAARRGHPQVALDLLQQAAASEPANDRFLHDLGELCYRLNLLEAAEQALRRAMDLAPTRTDLPVKLGFVQLRRGRPVEALALVERALAHTAPPLDELGKLSAAILQTLPGDARALHGAGLVEARAGRTEQATRLLEQAADIAPTVASHWDDLALLHVRLNRLDAAGEAFDRAIALAPRRADLYVKQALVRQRQQRSGDAASLLRQAIALAPQALAAKVNLANLLASGALGTDDFDEALRLYEEALAVQPNDPDLRMNYGNLLLRLERPAEAIACYRQSLAAAPDNLDAWVNLGRAEQMQGRLDDAERAFRAALERNSEHPAAQRGLGHVLLAQGRLAEGWEAYRYRSLVDAAEGRLKLRPFRQPWWRGEPLAGRRMLAWAEQGVGEELMFASVLPELIAEAAEITVESDPRLVPLFARSFPHALAVLRATPPDSRAADPAIDFQCPFGDLAAQRRPSFESFPRHAGYLSADPGATAQARSWLDRRGHGKKIGIAWFSENKNNGGRRSIPLRRWARFLQRADVVAVDLQYGDTAAERDAVEREFGWRVHRHPEIEQLADLDGFAALVSALDLVITISNTTAHMAGALGKPCWVLLHDAPYWHWFPSRADCPWYPSVRLFRQSRAGTWDDVLDRASDAFEDWRASSDGD
jgi:tetratricopeptide (TPR) repeat protein